LKRIGVLIFLVSGVVSAEARAGTHVELLVIGNNHAAPEDSGADAGPALPPLRYADDDAAAFYDLLAEGAESAHLLTVMDTETEGRFPKLAGLARPPTLAAVRAAVTAIQQRIESHRAHGDQSVLYFFFSGHGTIRATSGPGLALLDGDVSHEILYEEILGKLPADYVHVFVDACHAEGVVRPRDGEARVVPVKASDANAFLVHSTLARFPNVGAIVAATSDAQAHEWDQLEHGVFTSELLSALRGAADVNRDRRVEYSEVYAFLAAANRSVQDPRARLSVVARPPEIDRHVAIIDLSRPALARAVQLRGVLVPGRLVELEDGDGQRLAAFRGEPDYVADLVLPAGTIYVRMEGQEASFESRPGETVAFGQLKFTSARARARGAIEAAMRRGLLGSEFGRRYYTGFIDQAPDFAPVTFKATSPDGALVASGGAAPPGGALEIVAGAGVASTVADAFAASLDVRVGVRPTSRHGFFASVDVARAAREAIEERQLLASAGWLWTRRMGLARGWVGGALGGGVVEQLASGKSARRSGVFTLGPEVGASISAGRGFGLWASGQLAALAYREDGGAGFGLRPSILVGGSFAP
jgi:hypothetical protein